MNKTSSKRLISKQECMVLLANLPLTDCTEEISTIPTNNSRALQREGENKENKSFVTEYEKRDDRYEHLSMYSYYVEARNTPKEIARRRSKKISIPHFTGVNGAPTYPVTEAYARYTILVYRPFRAYPRGLDWKLEFENFINSPNCPVHCRMSYERVMRRYYDNLMHCEPTTTEHNHSQNELNQDDKELLTLVGLHESDLGENDDSLISTIERGLDFNWDKAPQVKQYD